MLCVCIFGCEMEMGCLVCVYGGACLCRWPWYRLVCRVISCTVSDGMDGWYWTVTVETVDAREKKILPSCDQGCVVVRWNDRSYVCITVYVCCGGCLLVTMVSLICRMISCTISYCMCGCDWNCYGWNSRCEREKEVYRHVIMWVSLYGGTKDHMCVLP